MPELSASLRVPNYSAAPTTPTPATGHLYYDTGVSKLYYYDGAWKAVSIGAGAGDFSSNTATSVANEIVLFADATGKLGKRATGSGIATLSSGQLGTTPDNHTNWDTAFTNNLRWDGGSTSLVAATGRTSLGGTTVGQAFFTLTNPGAITFPKMTAANAVVAESAGTYLTSLGGTTVGQNFFTLANPGAVTFPKISALNAVVAESAATYLASLGGTTVGINFFDLANPGAISFPKIDATNNVIAESASTFRTSLSLVASATTDTTNASNITSGTLPTAQGALPTGGATGYALVKTSATNFAATFKAAPLPAANTATQSGFASDTYVTGSRITIAAGDVTVGSVYRCLFHISKTAFGTAAFTVNIRMGTAGTTSDTLVQNIAFTAGTAIADQGIVEVYVVFTTVGASAVVNCFATMVHNNTTAGLSNTGSGLSSIVGSLITSAAFNSTAITKIGISVNGGTWFVGTMGVVEARFNQP